MPLTEPRNVPQFWPLPQDSYTPPPAPAAIPQLATNLDLIEKRIYQLAQETALRFEALRRMLNLDEGQLLATEKTIIAERTAPRGGVGQEDVVRIVQGAIEQNNEVIRNMLDSIVQIIKTPPAANTTDPLEAEPGFAPAEEAAIPEVEAGPAPEPTIDNSKRPTPNWKQRKH